jgi:hypothetical protein
MHTLHRDAKTDRRRLRPARIRNGTLTAVGRNFSPRERPGLRERLAQPEDSLLLVESELRAAENV